jgi:hypothetical protein
MRNRKAKAKPKRRENKETSKFEDGANVLAQMPNRASSQVHVIEATEMKFIEGDLPQPNELPNP